MRVWDKYESMAARRKAVSSVVQRTYGWRNDLFFPEDECSVLFYEFCGLDLLTVEFVLCLEDMNLSTAPIQWWETLWKDIHALKYNDFLTRLH